MSRRDDYNFYCKAVDKFVRDYMLELQVIYGGNMLQITDGGYTKVNIMPWSAKYHIEQTSYGEIWPGQGIAERTDERDLLPGDFDQLMSWLHSMFFPIDEV